MDGFDGRTYGDSWAAVYDELHAGLADTQATVGGLDALVEPGAAVVEFGAGTGRIAVPLAERGHDVVAVEISEAMLAQLRAKPGAEKLTVVHGDMTRVALGRTFDLAVVAFNSIFALPSQDDQVRLFGNAAAHLRHGGRFVLETAVPAVPDGRTLLFAPERLGIHTGTLDPVTGRYHGTWAIIEPTGTTFYPIDGRHVGHAEMDLMARLAGLILEHRWADWARAPFTAGSLQHVSIYRKPG